MSVAQFYDKAKVDSLLTAHTILTPVYSDTPTFSDWTFADVPTGVSDMEQPVFYEGSWSVDFMYATEGRNAYAAGDTDAVSLSFAYSSSGLSLSFTATRTRTDIIGYTLGNQDKKSLASAEVIQFKEWFPGGEAKSIEDCTKNLKFDWDNADETNHTVEVLPFCNTGDSTKDNSDKSGRVVIPPYVDHEGTRYKVTGVVSGNSVGDENNGITGIVAPTTVTSIGDGAFSYCVPLTSVSFPAVTSIGENVFFCCTSLATVSLHAVENIGESAFYDCASLSSVDFGPDARQSVPTFGPDAFPDLSQSGHTCRIVVPDSQFTEWTTNENWAELTSKGYEFVKWSSTQPIPRGDVEGVYAKLTDVPSAEQQEAWTRKVWEYANLSAFPVTGVENRVYVDKSTNLTYRWDTTSSSYVQIGGSSIDVDAAISTESANPVQNSAIATALSGKADSAALADPFDSSKAYPANSYVTHDGLMYKCASSVAAGAWDASDWTQVDLMAPDATFDVLADGRLRISDASGNELWSQGYNLASGSATALSCDKVNYFEFAATNYAAFSESETYAVDAVVVYNGKVYTCTTAVGTAGPWTGSTNWTETLVSQEFTLPKAENGKVGDFILDVSNTNNSLHEVHVLPAGTLGTDYDAIVPRGESLAAILTVPAGGLAEFYFTTTAFGTAAKPAWKVVRQLVEKETIQP